MSDNDSADQVQAGLLGRWDAQRRFYRVIAICALVFGVFLAGVSAGSFYLSLTTGNAVNAQRARSEAVGAKVDKVLGIAQGFACMQNPPPKGCPPQPPTTGGTQAIIDQVVNRIISELKQIYPPPEAP